SWRRWRSRSISSPRSRWSTSPRGSTAPEHRVTYAPHVSADREQESMERFRASGRILLSLGLVKGTEGNLSTFDGQTLVITRTGSSLGRLEAGDLIAGPLEADLAGASSDLAVHRGLYRDRGPGAIAHAHPPGTVGEGRAEPGAHGSYEFAPTLERAVEEIVRSVRAGPLP